jgi:tetratricopeptide (TPR) repeat protein
LGPRIAAGEVYALWQLNTVVEELHGHGQGAAMERLLRQAIPLAERMAAREGSSAARGQLAYLLYVAGRTEPAATLYRALAAEQPQVAEFRLRHALLAARRGDPGPAREAMNWLGALEGDALARAVPQGQMAYWGSPEGWRALAQARLLAQLGDRDRAIEMLRAALARGLAHGYLHLHDDPDFDSLRGLVGMYSLLRPRG